MKSMISKIKDAPLSLTTGAMASFYAGQAAAQEGSPEGSVGAMFDGFSTQARSVGEAALAISFAGGLFFVGMGLARLKAASDTQGQQVKYSEGLWRVGLGACMVAIPGVIKIMQTSAGIDGGEAMQFSPGFSGG